MSAQNDSNDALAQYAQALRKQVPAADQAELFKVAVEAGCLAAFGDLEVDPKERQAIVAAVGVLSVGEVVEWEADALVDECAKRIADDGIEARVAAVGAALKRFGQADAGLLLAALVADASTGIDNVELGVLEAIAQAADVPGKELAQIVADVGRFHA